MTRAEKQAWLARLAAGNPATAEERAQFQAAEHARLSASFRRRAAVERLRVLRNNAEAYRRRGEPIDDLIAQAEAELAGRTSEVSEQ